MNKPYRSDSYFETLVMHQPAHMQQNAIPGTLEYSAAWISVRKAGGESVAFQCREVFNRHGKRQVEREVQVTFTRDEAIRFLTEALDFLKTDA